MAKGLRSNIKQAFKRARRDVMKQHPLEQQREDAIQDVLQCVLAQGEAHQAALAAARELAAAEAPQSMATDEPEEQETAEPKGRTLAKKIRKGKRSNNIKLGISGANQFHRWMSKGRRKKLAKNHHPGYTLTTSLR